MEILLRETESGPPEEWTREIELEV